MKHRTSTWITLIILLVVLLGVPLLLLSYQARRTGMTLTEFARTTVRRMTSKDVEETALGGPTSAAKGPTIAFVQAVPIGEPFKQQPRICHVNVVDLDRDKLLDVIACDAVSNRVVWIRQQGPGTFVEIPVGQPVPTPAHVEAVDIDRDGDLDLLVAAMGMLFPNNDRIGSVVIMENDGRQGFTNRVLIDHIARVTDVQAGDLDGDGDVDLAVGQFGYDDGELRWMENKGPWQFESHMLLNLSGTIHIPVIDVDGDGDLDIVALVSQEWEEIYVFVNDGRGQFETKRVYGSTNEDYGSSGIWMCDLDKDGDQDILFTNGDAFDYLPPRPRPWHGVQWLENTGNISFAFHRIAYCPGAYSPRPVDVDGDGDLDVVAASAFNAWEQTDAQSLVWYENDGRQRFTEHNLASNPTHLITLETGDFDGDGDTDFVTGGMHICPPYDRMGRVTMWRNRWAEVKAGAQTTDSNTVSSLKQSSLERNRGGHFPRRVRQERQGVSVRGFGGRHDVSGSLAMRRDGGCGQ